MKMSIVVAEKVSYSYRKCDIKRLIDRRWYKMNRIYCIGELLIDLVSVDGENYLKKPGGAPANVAVAVSKLGGAGYFLGQVGEDQFGDYLEGVLLENGVNTSLMEKGGKTTLALVTLDQSGERSFDFYRGSDSEYTIEGKVLDLTKGDIVHFGSATAFLKGELETTYYHLLEVAKNSGAVVSFDPNYRDVLITSDLLETYKKHCLYFMKEADFIKLSDEEAMLLTQTTSLEAAIKALEEMDLKTIAITLGKEGTMVISNGNRETIGSIQIEQKDSTGAGDAFVGGVLYGIAKSKGEVDYKEVITFANVVGAMTCENYGAIPAIPTLEEVEARMK